MVKSTMANINHFGWRNNISWAYSVVKKEPS